jgi:hypothetical protein
MLVSARSTLLSKSFLALFQVSRKVADKQDGDQLTQDANKP